MHPYALCIDICEWTAREWLRGAHKRYKGRLFPRSLARPREEPKVLPKVACAPKVSTLPLYLLTAPLCVENKNYVCARFARECAIRFAFALAPLASVPPVCVCCCGGGRPVLLRSAPPFAPRPPRPPPSVCVCSCGGGGVSGVRWWCVPLGRGARVGGLLGSLCSLRF